MIASSTVQFCVEILLYTTCLKCGGRASLSTVRNNTLILNCPHCGACNTFTSTPGEGNGPGYVRLSSVPDNETA